MHTCSQPVAKISEENSAQPRSTGMLRRLEWSQLSPVLWGKAKNTKQLFSSPSVRRWVRAGGRSGAHVSSRLCRAPSSLLLGILGPHLTWCEFLRCLWRGRRGYSFGGSLIPPFLKATETKCPLWVHKRQWQNCSPKHMQLRKEYIQQLCSPVFKEQAIRKKKKKLHLLQGTLRFVA